MKKKLKASPIDEFLSLSDKEKDRIAAQFGHESVPSRPLNTNERGQWCRLKRKMGRPRIGQGTRVISITVEKALLKRLDHYAQSHDLSRARVIAQGVESVLSQ